MKQLNTFEDTFEADQLSKLTWCSHSRGFKRKDMFAYDWDGCSSCVSFNLICLVIDVEKHNHNPVFLSDYARVCAYSCMAYACNCMHNMWSCGTNCTESIDMLGVFGDQY